MNRKKVRQTCLTFFYADGELLYQVQRVDGKKVIHINQLC